MAPHRRWAAVLSRTELTPLRDPHPASAMTVVDGMTYCSSILPWRSCGDRSPSVAMLVEVGRALPEQTIAELVGLSLDQLPEVLTELHGRLGAVGLRLHRVAGTARRPTWR